MADDDDYSGWASSNSTTGPDSPSSDRSKKLKAGLRSAGSGLSDYGSSELDRASSTRITPVAYRNGGKVRKTGPAIVHRNERVIPASKRKKAERLMKRGGMSLTNKTRTKGR